jgi:hypothetical protein
MSFISLFFSEHKHSKTSHLNSKAIFSRCFYFAVKTPTAPVSQAALSVAPAKTLSKLFSPTVFLI